MFQTTNQSWSKPPKMGKCQIHGNQSPTSRFWSIPRESPWDTQIRLCPRQLRHFSLGKFCHGQIIKMLWKAEFYVDLPRGKSRHVSRCSTFYSWCSYHFNMSPWIFSWFFYIFSRDFLEMLPIVFPHFTADVPMIFLGFSHVLPPNLPTSQPSRLGHLLRRRFSSTLPDQGLRPGGPMRGALGMTWCGNNNSNIHM